jgi:hypothetical protein
MLKSSYDDFAARAEAVGRSGHRAPAALIALALAAAGSALALLIGLLTFGVQATAAPTHVPLAVGATAPALAPIAKHVAAQGGGAVSWRTVTSRAEAERLLDAKQVYGVVLFSPGPGGPIATVLLSGALNPSAAQVAEPVLTQVAAGVLTQARTQPAAGPALQVVTIRPTSAAGRLLPLAASALLWLATMATNVLVVVAGPRLRGGQPLGRAAAVVGAVGSALLGTTVVVGLAHAWDATLPLGWSAAGFLTLVGLAFALPQAAVLRWLGPRGLIVLGPLYLMAPAVAGLVPELLNPVYRDLLWSWTPFRFSADGLRSLLFLGGDAPDVRTALWVFGAIAAAGLLGTLAPSPARTVSP